MIANQQNGTANTFTSVPFNTLPVVTYAAIPSNGIISPAPGNQAFYYVPNNQSVPYVLNYNLIVQRAVGHKMSFDVGYVGNVSRHLSFNSALNAALPGTWLNGEPLYAAFGRIASTTLRAYGRNAEYNSLQANYTIRAERGLTLNVAYAFSKSLDNAGCQDPYNYHLCWAPSSFDQTQLLTISHVYEPPFGKGKAFMNRGGVVAHVVGDWQLNGVFRYQTGPPFTPTAPTTTCSCPGLGIYANVIGNPVYLDGVGPGQPWVSTSAFALPAPNSFGTAGRNILRGPGEKNYDFSLFRTFPVWEKTRLEFRAEFSNLTNTPHFSNPASNLGAPNFGIISGSGYNGNRQTTLAMRLTF